MAVAARFVIETIATWAVHIHWDPAPQPFAADTVADTVVALLMSALLGESTPRTKESP